MTEEVGSLRVGLSMDSAKFEQSMSSIDRNLKTLGQEMAIVRAKGKEWGNTTEGLTVKQKTLSTLLESQDVKVRKLNEAHKKAVLEQGANSKAAENLAIKINKATAEYTKTETELSQVTAELKKQVAGLKDNRTAWEKTADSMDKAGDKLQNFGDKAKTVGTGLSVGLTAPILAVGAAGVAAFNEVDEALDTIITKTGATGESAEGLATSFEVVAKRVPNELLSVGEAIGEVNTQFGFLGKELEDNSQLMLQFADINGTDVTSSSIAAKQAIQAYGMANKDLGKVLDAVTKTAQDTGQSVDYLFDKAVEGAPQIKALGLTFAQGTALIGSFEKSGVDSAGALSSLSKASIVYAKDGKTMEQGLKGTIKSILEAKTETKALTVAAEVFGTKGAVRMVDAIKRGTFNLEEFADAGTKATGAVKNTFNETVDPIDEAKIALNNAKIAMGEVGDAVQVAMLPFLKEATEVLGNLTEKFQDLDPETKVSIVKFAALAAAIGPAVLVGGHMATSLGAIMKLASPLIATIGKAGLAGSFVALANPIGLTVAGVAGLTVAVGAGVAAYKEANKVNIEALETKQKEIDKNDKLIESFDALRSKNQLTNEQMLRYLDNQAELESTNAPDRVAALKDEQAKLLEKSTLTNDQMDEFLVLNDKVIDTAPETVKAISSEGEAFATNTQALKELNAEKAKQLEQAAYETLVKSLEKEKGLLNDQKQLITEINEKNALQQQTKQTIGQLTKDIRDQEALILDLENQKSTASLDEIQNLDNKIRREQEVLHSKEEQKLEAERMIITYGKQIDSRGELLETNRKEIALAEEARFKYEEIILAQAGITAERGRGGQQLSEELNKLELQKTKLSELLQAGKIGTQEYQDQNGKIDTQISKLQTAKNELQLINDVAGKKVFKDLDINVNPKNIFDTLDANLSRSVSKSVNIRYNNLNGPQAPGYKDGTNSHPGGPAIVGDGVGNNAGRELIELPNQKLFLSPAKPTLLNLPKGTSVLSAINTRKALGNVPKYASGTKNTSTSKPFELVNYDNRLKAVADGSGVARIREIRNAEIESLEKKIELLTHEGATIKQLNQAKEMETRLTKLQSEKIKEYKDRIKEQQITVEVLNKAYKNKKISLSEYNIEVAKAKSEIHKLTAEQMAFNVALSKRQDLADTMKEFSNRQMKAYETVKEAQLKQLSDRNAKSEDLFKKETSLYIEELNRQKDAALNSFDAQTKAHEASVNRQIENLKKKRDAEIGAIDAQLDALKEIEKVESREEIEAGFGTKKENLNRRLTIANFMGDEDTVKAVNSEIESLDKEIAKQRLNWQREDTREALSLEKERIDQSYDLQQKEIENNLVLWKEARDRERENLEAHFELQAEQFTLMREQQLKNLELQHENNLVAAEREFEFQKGRFAALQEQLALHLENGTITQKQANAAWLLAMKNAGNEQVVQEIENQEKSKVALNTYVSAYLDVGKKYGNNLIDGVVNTLNTRLSEVAAAAARIKSAMSIDTSSTMQAAAFNTKAINSATPVTNIAPQLININMDGEEIASYALSHATGALRQVSRKG